MVILTASDSTLPAFVAIDKGTRAVLAASTQPRFEVFTEPLDLMRFPGAKFEPELLALMAKKYANQHIDAIIAAGPPALEFAARHRDRLWPGAPILRLAGTAPSGTSVSTRRSRRSSAKWPSRTR